MGLFYASLATLLQALFCIPACFGMMSSDFESSRRASSGEYTKSAYERLISGSDNVVPVLGFTHCMLFLASAVIAIIVFLILFPFCCFQVWLAGGKNNTTLEDAYSDNVAGPGGHHRRSRRRLRGGSDSNNDSEDDEDDDNYDLGSFVLNLEQLLGPYSLVSWLTPKWREPDGAERPTDGHYFPTRKQWDSVLRNRKH